MGREQVCADEQLVATNLELSKKLRELGSGTYCADVDYMIFGSPGGGPLKMLAVVEFKHHKLTRPSTMTDAKRGGYAAHVMMFDVIYWSDAFDGIWAYIAFARNDAAFRYLGSPYRCMSDAMFYEFNDAIRGLASPIPSVLSTRVPSEERAKRYLAMIVEFERAGRIK